ncbi:MAG: BamA/TamA family outer membrane protein [Bacteroidales bacterium]|nr:BamA/TamA family outer membrane protein [Candidatus Cacconaster merdequi]
MKRGPAIILVILLLAASCSTTRRLQEGELRLADNTIRIVDGGDYDVSDLTPYIKQKPNGYFVGRFNPFLCVYNWSNGNGSGWDRFCEKLGQAPVVFDSTLVQPSITGILNHLEYMGYYGSEVSASTDVKDRKAFVRYDIHLGKQYPVESIRYTVRDTVLNAIMQADSTNYTIFPGDPLSQDALEKESERLAQLFRNHGYWGFSKNYFFYFADTTTVPSMAKLNVNIEEYTRNESPENASPHKRYVISKVNIMPQAGLKVRPNFLNSLNRIEEGSLYSEETISNTYERFTSVPAFSTVNMQIDEADSSSLSCNILLSPSKIQSVKVNLDASFNSNGLFGVTPSLIYSHKNIFGGGEIWNLGFKGNFQFRFNDPVRANEFSFNTSLVVPQFWLLPQRFFNRKVPKTEIRASFSYNDRPEYTRDVVSFQYGYLWNRNDNRLSFQVAPVWLSLVNTKNISEEFIQKIPDPTIIASFVSHIDLGSRSSVYYTTSNQINPDHTYFYFRGNLVTAGNLVNALYSLSGKDEDEGERTLFNLNYNQFVRLELSAVNTLRFGSSNQFALATRLLAGAGFTYGNSFNLPEEHSFYAGGANSMRGWQARTIGPGCAELYDGYIIRNQTGDMRLEANAEFRFPIVWKLKGCVFADAGNIWLMQNRVNHKLGLLDEDAEFRFKTMLRSSGLDWGLGARLDFGLVLVRLDIGYKLYDPRQQSWLGPKQWFKEEGYALHFGIGYPF